MSKTPSTLVIFGAILLMALPAAVLGGLLAYVVVKRLAERSSVESRQPATMAESLEQWKAAGWEHRGTRRMLF